MFFFPSHDFACLQSRKCRRRHPCKMSKTSLEDQPWHGNAVVSLGSKQFKPSEFLGERCRSGGSGNHESGAGTGGVNSSMASALSLANYSLLGPAAKAPVHMTTERRGITIQQIQKLLDFVSLMVQFWTGTHGDELGVPLTFRRFSTFTTPTTWVIKPATAGQHGQGCSYVEFLGSAMWIASHERNFSYIRQLSHDARNVFDCLWFCAIMILEEYNFLQCMILRIRPWFSTLMHLSCTTPQSLKAPFAA